MKINLSWGDLTDVSPSEKDALVLSREEGVKVDNINDQSSYEFLLLSGPGET